MPNKFPPRRAGAPRPPHRPTKFTEEQLAKALHIAGGVHAQACRVLQQTHGFTVTTSSMGRLVASSPRLQAVKAKAEKSRLDYAEAQLWRRIEAGDLPSIMFYLRFKGAKRGYTTTLVHQGDRAKPVATAAAFDFEGMPLDEQKMLCASLSRARMRQSGTCAAEHRLDD